MVAFRSRTPVERWLPARACSCPGPRSSTRRIAPRRSRVSAQPQPRAEAYLAAACCAAAMASLACGTPLVDTPLLAPPGSAAFDALAAPTPKPDDLGVLL